MQGKTYAERLKAYLLDKEQRLIKKETREKERAVRDIREREEKERLKKDAVKRKWEVEKNIRKDELKNLTTQTAERRREIKYLQHQEDRLKSKIKKINNYFNLTMEVCDLMDWRLQLLQKIQEDPYNKYVSNFQNIIDEIDDKLRTKRARLSYWQKQFNSST